MDPLLKTALLGTGKAPASPAAPTPVEPLLALLPGTSAERRLLLTAGARAVHRFAGHRALPGAPPPAAPPDPLPACPPAVASVVARLLAGEYRGLLPEACARLTARGWRLPEALLPAALDLREPEALRPVLGEWGRWLAGLRPEWRWALTEPVAAETVEEQKRRFEEESLTDRVAVLRRVRATDPARGREWLAPVLPKEKADERGAFVAALETGLSLADEALLEKALDDRAAAVRMIAAGLLAKLPGTAFAARQQTRADALLAFEAPSGGFFSKLASRVTGREGGKLVATPPQEIDKSWERDGIPSQPSGGVGKRAFWLAQVLALVPPSHWSERFGTSPASLVATAREVEDWSGALLQGFARAALRFADSDWAAVLFDAGRVPKAHAELAMLLTRLFPALAPDDREARVLGLLADPPGPGPLTLVEALRRLPAPWSPEISRRFLAGARRAAQRSLSDGAGGSGGSGESGYDPWLLSLPFAALALPPELFAEALHPWPLTSPAERIGRQRQWGREIEILTETVRLRETLWKETAL